MKSQAMIGLLMVFVSGTVAMAEWCVDGEFGVAFSGYNEVRIPAGQGDRFSLSEELSAAATPAARLRLTRSWKDRHAVELLVAPLRIKVEGSLDRDVRFDDEVFPAGVELSGTYRFDSYRLSYRYDVIRGKRLRLGIGLTGKIRAAEIELRGDGHHASYDNIGVVPLFRFRLQWKVSERWGVLVDGDALAAPQGRAEDVLVAAWGTICRSSELFAGYRLLEGGADNDKVYTFALVHYAVVGMRLTI